MQKMNGKTIAQIADEVGVSKQAIQKKMKKEPLRTILESCMIKKSGTIYINTDDEKLIKKEYGIKTTATSKTDETPTTKKISATILNKNEKTTEKDPVISEIKKVADNHKPIENKEKLPTTTKKADEYEIHIKNIKAEIERAEEPFKTTKKNFYEILDLNKNFTKKEINNVFQAIAHQLKNNEITQSTADNLFKAMNILAFPEKRFEYDKKINVFNVSAPQDNKVKPVKEDVTNELLTMIYDILMILGDSDRILKLNKYESKIHREICDFLEKVDEEITFYENV